MLSQFAEPLLLAFGLPDPVFFKRGFPKYNGNYGNRVIQCGALVHTAAPQSMQ